MKLYAKMKSERALQGKELGGQEYIDIIVNGAARNNLCRLYVENRKDEVYIELLDYSTGQKYILSAEQEKGEKQKGEKIACENHAYFREDCAYCRREN